MRTDPAGRAGVSQRGSNSEMRTGERRRSEFLQEEGGKILQGEEEEDSKGRKSKGGEGRGL